MKTAFQSLFSFPASDKRLPVGQMAPGNNLDPEVVIPFQNIEGEPLSEEEKIEKLVAELRKAYKKNQSLAKANKSLRLQLHQATKKTLSQKSKNEIVREIMSVSLRKKDCFIHFSFSFFDTLKPKGVHYGWDLEIPFSIL